VLWFTLLRSNKRFEHLLGFENSLTICTHASTQARTHVYVPVNPNQERQAVVAGLLLLELVVFLSQSRRGCKAGARGVGGRERPRAVASICDRIASVRRCWMLGVQNLTG
jgi:hypothetical protein